MMNITDILGSLAGLFTTISFIPQLMQVIKTKSTKDISLPMFLIFSLGVICWLLYGVLLRSLPVILANFSVLLMSFVIIGYKLRYK